MFSIFKKKSATKKLEDRYAQLLKEAYRLQSVNRKESDQKYADADAVLTEIKQLEEQ